VIGAGVDLYADRVLGVGLADLAMVVSWLVPWSAWPEKGADNACLQF